MNGTPHYCQAPKHETEKLWRVVSLRFCVYVSTLCMYQRLTWHEWYSTLTVKCSQFVFLCVCINIVYVSTFRGPNNWMTSLLWSQSPHQLIWCFFMALAPYIDDVLVFTDSGAQGSDNREVLPHPGTIILSKNNIFCVVCDANDQQSFALADKHTIHNKWI